MKNLCHLVPNWLSRAGIFLTLLTIFLKPGVIEASRSWQQRYSQFDNLMSPLTFNNVNKDNNNNNKITSNNANGNKKVVNPIESSGNVKHFNYRHIALGSTLPRQGSWKKWIPSPLSSSLQSSSSSSSSLLSSSSSPSSSLSSSSSFSSSPSVSSSSLPSSIYSSSSSSFYPPYSLHRSLRQHNNLNSHFNDNNCSRFERNCHDCRRHDCSFLQCDGPELSNTICLNVASPTLFSRPSIHKVLSQCHFIEQCPLSSQLDSNWMTSSNDLVDRPLFGSKSSQSSGNDDLSVYSSDQQTRSSDSYAQRSLFSGTIADSDRKKLNSASSVEMSNYFGLPPNASASSSSTFPHKSQISTDLSDASFSDSGHLFRTSYSLTENEDNQNDNSALSRPNLNQKERPQNRKRVSLHRYPNTGSAWRHNGANDAIVASPLVADSGRLTTLKIGSSSNTKFQRSASSSGVHIGLGTIIALMLCSSLVLSAVMTVAYKKITKIYRNNRSGAYGVLEDQ